MALPRLLVLLPLLSPQSSRPCASGEGIVDSRDNSFGEGALSLDCNTGLEWLDLTLTQGRSVNDILNGFGGYIDAGFVVASTDQVEKLAQNFGVLNTGVASDLEADREATKSMIEYLDETASDASTRITAGFVERIDMPGKYSQTSAESWWAANLCSQHNVSTPCSRVLVVNSSFSPDQTTAYVGIMLNRPSSHTPEK